MTKAMWDKAGAGRLVVAEIGPSVLMGQDESELREVGHLVGEGRSRMDRVLHLLRPWERLCPPDNYLC